MERPRSSGPGASLVVLGVVAVIVFGILLLDPFGLFGSAPPSGPDVATEGESAEDRDPGETEVARPALGAGPTVGLDLTPFDGSKSGVDATSGESDPLGSGFSAEPTAGLDASVASSSSPTGGDAGRPGGTAVAALPSEPFDPLDVLPADARLVVAVDCEAAAFVPRLFGVPRDFLFGELRRITYSSSVPTDLQGLQRVAFVGPAALADDATLKESIAGLLDGVSDPASLRLPDYLAPEATDDAPRAIRGRTTLPVAGLGHVVALLGEQVAFGGAAALDQLLARVDASTASSGAVRERPGFAVLTDGLAGGDSAWAVLDFPPGLAAAFVAAVEAQPAAKAFLRQLSIEDVPPLDGIYVGAADDAQGGAAVNLRLRFATEQGAKDVAKLLKGLSVLPLPIPPEVKAEIAKIGGGPRGRFLDLTYSLSAEIFDKALARARAGLTCRTNMMHIYFELLSDAQFVRDGRFIHSPEGSLATFRAFLATRYGRDLDPKELVCPLTDDVPAVAGTGAIVLGEANLSYEFAPWEVSDGTRDILFYCAAAHEDGHRFVCLADGTLETITDAELEARLAAGPGAAGAASAADDAFDFGDSAADEGAEDDEDDEDAGDDFDREFEEGLEGL